MTESGAGAEELTEIVFTSDNSDFDSDSTALITKVDIYYDEDEDAEIDSDEESIVENASTAITTVASNTVTLSIDDDFSTSETRYYIVEFTLADEADLDDEFTITFATFDGSTTGDDTVSVSLQHKFLVLMQHLHRLLLQPCILMQMLKIFRLHLLI